MIQLASSRDGRRCYWLITKGATAVAPMAANLARQPCKTTQMYLPISEKPRKLSQSSLPILCFSRGSSCHHHKIRVCCTFNLQAPAHLESAHYPAATRVSLVSVSSKIFTKHSSKRRLRPARLISSSPCARKRAIAC